VSGAPSRYDSTTAGISRGANACRSIASSIGTTTGSSSATTIDPGEERDDRRGEGIVLIAGHHVPGARDVGVAGVRDEVQEGARAGFADDVALVAADQQRRHADRARGGRQARRALPRARPALAAHEARVPVPVVAAVGPATQVLAQSVQITR